RFVPVRRRARILRTGEQISGETLLAGYGTQRCTRNLRRKRRTSSQAQFVPSLRKAVASLHRAERYCPYKQSARSWDTFAGKLARLEFRMSPRTNSVARSRESVVPVPGRWRSDRRCTVSGRLARVGFARI